MLIILKCSSDIMSPAGGGQGVVFQIEEALAGKVEVSEIRTL